MYWFLIKGSEFMRIGIFTETYKPYVSGVVTSIIMLKKSLEQLGNEVYIVTINQNGIKYEYDEKEKILRVPGIDSKIYDDLKISSIYPIKSLLKIKKWNLDIIHTHTEGTMGTYGRLLAKQFNIPVVHTYHTMYEDYIYLITKGHFDKPAKKILQYFTVFYCDKIVSELIVPTKKTYDLFKKKYQIERQINIIPTGIDIERFKKDNYDKKDLLLLRKKYNVSKNDFVLLLVSRISEEQKNINFLLKQQEKINKHHKDIKLLVVGDGPDLNKFKQEYKNNKNIIFTGMIPWDEVSKYYQIGNIFVTASKTETQGLTVIEAISSGLPVVCMEDDSFKLAIINEYNGLFFNDEEEYLKNILYLYENRKKYTNMSKQAVNSSEQFSSEMYGKKILEVYNRAIENRKNNIYTKIKNVFRKRCNNGKDNSC